jgi:hypothetical protein
MKKRTNLILAICIGLSLVTYVCIQCWKIHKFNSGTIGNRNMKNYEQMAPNLSDIEE